METYKHFFQVSSYVMFANISLTKANYMAGPRKRDRGQSVGADGPGHSGTALQKLHNIGHVYRKKEKRGPFFRLIFRDIPCF